MPAPEDFSEIDWNETLDIEAYLRHAPEDATIRGIFFDDLVQMWPAEERPGPYRTFRKYPCAEFMRLLGSTAAHAFPDESPRQGLRLLGRRLLKTFLQSTPGRVFAALTHDPLTMFKKTRSALEVVQNYGHSRLIDTGERHVVLGFEEIWDFLDSHYVGVLEGVVLHWGLEPEVFVRRHALDAADLYVRW